MHFEILVEDRSGEIALKHLVPKILPKEHTWGIKSYKGIGHLPKDLKPNSDPVKRAFLNQLPRVLQGYGKTYSHRAKDYPVAVIVICDLDDKNREEFLTELNGVLQACHPQPPFARFCLAIEEGEAWLLGDVSAITKVYAQAKLLILRSYQNDSICGTWELLADALFKGGAMALKSKGPQAVGAEKCKWAENITPFMDVEQNQSPSFIHFRENLRKLPALAGTN